MSFNHSLVLCPSSSDASIEDESAKTFLLESGLIDRPIEGSTDSYYAGERYLDLISFVGCSTQIEFERPIDGSPFCYIHIHNHPKPFLMRTEQNARNPRCPECRSVIDRWEPESSEREWCCEYCMKRYFPNQFDWGRTAGFARYFIELTNIFPKEALPQDGFMRSLKRHTGSEWKYFYISRTNNSTLDERYAKIISS